MARLRPGSSDVSSWRMTRLQDERPWLVGSRTWLMIGVALVVTTLTLVAWFMWETFDHRRKCDRLERRVVTNQEEADRLFDDRAAADCLGR